MNRTMRNIIFATLIVITGILLAGWGQQVSPLSTAIAALPKIADSAVLEPVAMPEGPNWLQHVKLSVADTHMGKMGGTDPQTAQEAAQAQPVRELVQKFLTAAATKPEEAAQAMNESFPATGEDLYRWNCRSCHGADGKGYGPEINSVIGPVQGTSAEMTRARMAARGIDADDDMVNQVTDLAKQALQDRLQHGGTNMPAFAYLRADERAALIAYLEKLANVPGSINKPVLTVPESPQRVGSLIVNSTCHICHDGTGPGAGMGAIMQGRLPSLASMPQDISLSGMVHQVHYGSCNMMHRMGMAMPAYPYLDESEVAAAYFALSAEPNQKVVQAEEKH